MQRRRPLRPLAALAFAAALAVAQDPPPTQDYDDFKANCASCHTIGGGRLAGPDLKGAADRKDRAWLAGFVADPKAVIDSGDPYARRLLEEARGVVMPAIPGMTRARAERLVDLTIYESKQPKSKFAGTPVSDRPLTSADVARGEAIFLGRTPLMNGGPACNGCHTVVGLDGFGGGRLGPDLSGAFARLDGRKALAAWLVAPPSPTMSPVYKSRPIDPEEALAVVAYLKEKAAEGTDAPPGAAVDFLVAGFAGAAAFLALADWAWRRRFRGVRRALVNGR